MRRLFAALLASVLCGLACCLPAAANQVSQMTIDVALREDGSALVTQVWEAETDEGTEFYLVCRDSGYLRITDFSASDENGAFQVLEPWDVDASLDEKAGKCGVVETDRGVELCWGIGAYGRKTYTISYVLHGLVGAYDDADGFNHRFVDEMATFPTSVSLTIRREDGGALEDADCDVWGFGFDGNVWFDGGTVRARTASALESGEHLTVMLSLAKGLLSPERSVDESFDTVKERAFDGSDYENEEEEGGWLDLILGLGVMGAVFGLIALWGVAAARRRKAKMNKRTKRVEYFRDAPNDGNLNVTHRLGSACEVCREDALLGAYLLRLISDGALEPVENGGRGEQVDLRLCRPPRSGGAFDDAFYTILEAAAGSDGVLQAKELERFCGKNAKPLAAFAESCRKDADRILIHTGCCRGAECKGVKSLTGAGQRQLDQILGLKRFLLDFSLIHERGVRETVIWQDYLIYAHLLGIADKVAPQIRKLYPDELPQVERFQRYIGYAGWYNGYLYRACERELRMQEAARNSGSGGRASLGGGGGYSGGGGGGVR